MSAPKTCPHCGIEWPLPLYDSHCRGITNGQRLPCYKRQLATLEASCAAMREAHDGFRDAVLHGRHQLDQFDCDQINAVLGLLDDEFQAAFSTDAGKSLLDELAELRNWKQQALAVEATWDVQEVGKLLSLRLGSPIQANIEPKIRELVKQRDELAEALKQIAGKTPGVFPGGTGLAVAHERTAAKALASIGKEGV